MTDLIVATPSKARPHNLERLLEAMDRTCRADTQLVIGLDADDPSVEGYPPGDRVLYVIKDGLQRKVVEWVNILLEPYVDHVPALGHFGDDCVPRTDGWDERILVALEKRPFAFGNDLSIERPPGSLCTHLFMRSKVMKRLGYFGPPEIQHMYVDLAWMAWCYACGYSYLDDVIIEHMHFLEHKADFDASYQLSRQLVGADYGHMLEYAERRLNRDIHRIDPRVKTTYTKDEFLHVHRTHGLGI